MISKLDFILLRFLLNIYIISTKYQSTKINSLISTNNFTYSEFHYSELDQVLRIFHELYNISDKRQKEFPQILFHRFSPLFQFALPSFHFLPLSNRTHSEKRTSHEWLACNKSVSACRM